MNKGYVSKHCIGLFAALILCISAVCFTCYANQINTTVRVGLNYSTSAVDSVNVITSESSFNILVEGNAEFSSITANELNLTASAEKLYVKTIFGGDVVNAPAGKKISIYPNSVSSGLTVNGRHYYGGFEFYSDSNGKITVINVLDIENYVKGVLPSEIYPSWHKEALKVAAIVSRTFAMQNISSTKHSSSGFDVCNNTHCQMYEGTRKENANTNAAIEETAGIVIMYNGKLATTPYHSSSGGFSASASEVWGGKRESFPYLTNVFNPYENYRDVPNGKWISVVSPSEITSYISSMYASKLPGPVLTFEYDRSKLGFISNMTVSDNYGNSVQLTNADRVRAFFGKLVKSANFGIANTYVPSYEYSGEVSIVTSKGLETLTGLAPYEYITASGTQTATGFKEVIVIDGRGYGHGVGLSQYGSRDMANAGFTYDQIIMTYFPGTKLVCISQ